jgi:2-keto-4-pentenoate hydratase
MTSTTAVGVAEAARRLTEAARTSTPCRPVRDLIGASDVAAAYAVQQRLADERQARVVGHKIGLTSPAVQRQLGVDQPDFGLLFDDMDLSAYDVVPLAGLLQPKVEAEIAFVLGADLDTDDLTPSRVRAAVEHAVPALEIVDSRIAGWDITIADTIADNASSGLYVINEHGRPLEEVEPKNVTLKLTINSQQASVGAGAACLGDPLNALEWLARTAAHYGDPLRAGEVVLSGALGPMVGVIPGDEVSAEISGLGTVSARFGID